MGRTVESMLNEKYRSLLHNLKIVQSGVAFMQRIEIYRKFR